VIQTNVKVKTIESRGSCVHVTLSDGSALEAEIALIATGRKPYTEQLQLNKAGIQTTEHGFLAVNDRMETPVRGIFAIGDVTGVSMLAHVASHQGVVAAMNAAGMEATVHYDAVPAVIFTEPEIATVGSDREGTIKGRFPFAAIGKAQAAGDATGFAEIVADAKTKQIVAATVIGHDASNLIAEMALAIHNELTLECVVETIHAHPTTAEVWHEAASLALGAPIHLPPKRTL
jgi:dihydrolipoamide dehydrogenase